MFLTRSTLKAILLRKRCCRFQAYWKGKSCGAEKRLLRFTRLVWRVNMQERRILESWKDIAEYLKRSERTLRRWEGELGLPIHRLDGTPSARVFAYADELDLWMAEKLNRVRNEARISTSIHRRWIKWILVSSSAVAGLAVIAVLIWQVFSNTPTPAPSNNPVLAILPFENLTGDESLESWRMAYPDLLITDLRQSRYINVVPIPNVISALESLKLHSAVKFSADDLSKIADRFGAEFLTTGSLIRSGEDFIVNLFVLKSKTNQTVGTMRVIVHGEQQLLDKADNISKEIKRAFNLTPQQITGDIDESIRRIATNSAHAFKLYSRAIHMPQSEPILNIIAFLQEAIDLDPKFGLAYGLLSKVYGDTQLEDKVKCYENALALSNRMPERERFLLQADFYHFCRYRSGYAKLLEAGIPASTVKKLGPKSDAEGLLVMEKLGSLYPDFFAAAVTLSDLSRIYVENEEWEKAISALENEVKMPRSMLSFSRDLLQSYGAMGLFDKAEKLLDDLSRSGARPSNLKNLRTRLAVDRRKYDDALRYLAEEFSGQDPEKIPYYYYSSAGYIHWLKDDLAGAEQAYRKVIDPGNLTWEPQRSIDLAILCLSQGKIGQAVENATKGLELVKNGKGAGGRAREIHAMLAYFYRLAGQVPEALEEAEEACRDYDRPDVPAGQAVKLLHQRALIFLKTNRMEEFGSLTEEIKRFIEKEKHPKLMRVYYYLLGLRELKEKRAQRAIGYFSKALDLFTPRTGDCDPSACLFSLAEAYELAGNRWSAFLNFDEISVPGARESLSGEIYAKSFYRKARYYEYLWSQPIAQPRDQDRLKAIEYFRKFLSLWKDADPIFPEVDAAKQSLAVLESKSSVGVPR